MIYYIENFWFEHQSYKYEFLGIHLDISPPWSLLPLSLATKLVLGQTLALAFPLVANLCSLTFLKPIVEKIESKLRNWEHAVISKGSCLTD